MTIRASLPMYTWRPARTIFVTLQRRPVARALGICLLIAVGALFGMLVQEFAGRADGRRQVLQRELRAASEFLRFHSLPRIHRSAAAPRPTEPAKPKR